MGPGEFFAAGNGAIIGVLKMLLFERSNFPAHRTCRRCGQSIRSDAAHGRPPASRRTVDGTLFVAGAIAFERRRDISGWTKFSVAASGLLTALHLRSAEWKIAFWVHGVRRDDVS